MNPSVWGTTHRSCAQKKQDCWYNLRVQNFASCVILFQWQIMANGLIGWSKLADLRKGENWVPPNTMLYQVRIPSGTLT